MNKHLWLKIIAVIIIQVLLLTQVDFTLAAIYQSKDTFKEVTLKFQRITRKSASLVIGIGCAQLSLSGVHFFGLNALFNLLKRNSSPESEMVLSKGLSNINNGIYEVLTCIFTKIYCAQRISFRHENIRKSISRSKTEESTGPPIFREKVSKDLLNRIV